ncbi:MAG: NAD(P)/FAD-dependent oxidoreductase [Leptolyngbya sp.]|nr:NAD(P)/FAD-dependent oxidoreductase [Candidatus Melainabacteria bacterium]
MDTNYDVIVIGSGMGGLTFASLAAQLAGKKVLVLERHFKLGGYTHTFERKGFRWDVGLHYVGNLHPGSEVRNLFDKVTAGKLQWKQMPEYFDQFDYPDFSFPVASNKKRFFADLVKLFPAEEAGIRRHFADVKNANYWLKAKVSAPLLSPVLRKLSNIATARNERLALRSTKQYLDANFTDKKLKALLASQWMDYGVPPSMSAFVMHAVVVQHYFDGAFYPVGGSKSIADSIIPIIEEKGGMCLVNHKVTEIIVKDGAATGVVVEIKKGTEINSVEISAPIIVSDAGKAITYNDLLKNSAFHQPHSNSLASETCSAVTLYVGLKEKPTKLGFDGRNHWMFNGYDHDSDAHNEKSLLQGNPQVCYLSFPSLKSGIENESTKHTAEIIAPINLKAFSKWSDSDWKQRGQEYETFKQEIAEILVNVVEKKYPGFSDLIEYSELSTPLTNRDFTGHKFGSLYGIPATVETFRSKTWDPSTPVKNLYLTGADVVTLGIVGAAFGGLVTASHLYGGLSKFFEVISKGYETEE